MSIDIMSLAFKAEIRPASHKLCLLALADYANENDEAFPKVDTLAKKISLSRRATLDALRGLEKLGVITIRHQHRADGTRRESVYGFCLERLRELQSAVDRTVSDEQSAEIVKPECSTPPNQSAVDRTARTPILTPIEPKCQFKEFWSAYPHPKNRGGKESTKKLYSSSLRKISHDELCRAARAYGAFLAKPDEKWRQAKQAIGWLRHELWDEWLEGASPKPAEIIPPVDWSATVGYFAAKGEDPRSWSEGWGPAPNQPGCLCPPDILAAHGYHNTTEGRV